MPCNAAPCPHILTNAKVAKALPKVVAVHAVVVGLRGCGEMAAQWQSDQSSCAGPSSVHLPRAVTCIASAQAMGKPSPAALCRPMGPFINSPAPWRSASPRGHSPGTHCCTCPAGKWMGGPHRVGLVVQQRGRSWAAGPAAQHAAAVCLRLAPRLDGMPGMPVMRQSCKQQQGAQVQREQTTTGRYLGDVTVPQQLHAKAVLVVPARQRRWDLPKAVWWCLPGNPVRAALARHAMCCGGTARRT